MILSNTELMVLFTEQGITKGVVWKLLHIWNVEW